MNAREGAEANDAAGDAQGLELFEPLSTDCGVMGTQVRQNTTQNPSVGIGHGPCLV
jgi:hypothetical protein